MPPGGIPVPTTHLRQHLSTSPSALLPQASTSAWLPAPPYRDTFRRQTPEPELRGLRYIYLTGISSAYFRMLFLNMIMSTQIRTAITLYRDWPLESIRYVLSPPADLAMPGRHMGNLS